MGGSLTRHSSMSAEELVRACAESNDSEAWEEFVSRFHKAISLSIIHTAQQWGAVSRQLVDDLVQETYLKLCADKCRLLRDFAVEHPEAIQGYIKTIGANVTHDHFRSRYSQKRGAGRAEESLEELDPTAGAGSLGSPGTIERQILLKQIDQCLETCSVGPEQRRDRLIFWLHYQQGMSAKAISALPTVALTPKGVESAILRLTRLVREQMLNLRAKPTGGTQPDRKGFRAGETY